MPSFFEKNKRKSALALLLLFLRWKKGLAPLLMIVGLLLFVSFAPGNLMGVFLTGLARLPGGAHIAAGMTWTASKIGLHLAGINPYSRTGINPSSGRGYSDYLALFMSSRQFGLAALDSKDHSALLAAFKAAKERPSWASFFRGGGPKPDDTSLKFLVGGGDYFDDLPDAAEMERRLKGGKSVRGIANKGDGSGLSDRSVLLDASDLSGERAGNVASAYAGARLEHGNPLQKLGGSPAYASKSFFDYKAGYGPNSGKSDASGRADATKRGEGTGERLGVAGGQRGVKGGRMARFRGTGSRTQGMGRMGVRSSRALAQLRTMGTLNRDMRAAAVPGVGLEPNAAAARKQFEGSEIKGAASVPSPPGGAGSAGTGVNPAAGGYGGSIPAIPDMYMGDPGLVCTSQQLSQGYHSNGYTCVAAFTTPANKNVTPWQPKLDKAIYLILGSIPVLLLGAAIGDAGGSLQKSSFPPTAAFGVFLSILGSIIVLAAIMMLISALMLGISVMGEEGGKMQGGLVVLTAAIGVVGYSAVLQDVLSGSVGAFGNATAKMQGVMLAFLVAAIFTTLMWAMSKAMAQDPPKTPEIESPYAEEEAERAERIKFNEGSGYDVAVDQPPAPNVKEELNKQKGGGDSGMDPAPPGKHYEGDKLVDDYMVGVAERMDSNSMTDPGEGYDPAPAGQHYERGNTGDAWVLVDDYEFTAAEIERVNSYKGGGMTGLQEAPEGMHYEGMPPVVVKDYPVPGA